MRAVLQRVSRASLSVGGEEVSRIGKGLAVLISVGKTDTIVDAHWIAKKILDLKVFSHEGRMALSVKEAEGEILAISQFTLHAEVKKGRRPSFDRSAPPDLARSLIAEIVSVLRNEHPHQVAEGRFGEEMIIGLELIGPVTIWLDSKDKTGGTEIKSPASPS